MSAKPTSDNLIYQSAASPLGGSYTEKKLARLGLPSLKGLRFLDLGCNSGFHCSHAAAQGACRVVGVDLDEDVIRQARGACPMGEFHAGGWEVLPHGPFDVVIILSAIHYARDPVDLVRNIHDQLAPRGLLVIEGGLIDHDGHQTSDVLVPGWRQVGDRCRHLSHGYLKNHVLTGFDWHVHGPSEPRGGDDVTRFVVHARKKAQVEPRRGFHTVDLLEYAKGIARSARTIVTAQPAHVYVSRLPANEAVSKELLQSILSQTPLLDAFLIDLAYVLEPSKALQVELLPTLSPALLNAVVQELRARGFSAKIAAS
jgi:SAM-dependent methyltransferase